jgi:hypothetical protein
MNDKPLPFDERVHTTHVDTGHERFTAYPGHEVCDFCLSTAVVGAYDTSREISVDVGPITNLTNDPWACCEPCHELIEADDVEALVERAIDGIKTRQDESGTIDLTALLITISEFMEAKGEWRTR